jgi:hypothetical protein
MDVVIHACAACLSAKVVAGDGKRLGDEEEHKRDATADESGNTFSSSFFFQVACVRLTEHARVRPAHSYLLLRL